VIAFQPPTSVPRRVAHRLRRMRIAGSLARYRSFRSADMPAFTDDRAECKWAVTSQLPSCDVINLHWIARFVDYGSLFPQLPRRIPIVWTLHDMNPFTGGCHYTGGCEGYLHGCGNCPQLGSDSRNDLSHRIWQRKRESFEKLGPEQLHIVTASRWMADKTARSSLLGRFSVTHIPYGLDTDVFAPRDRHLAREVLNISRDAKVVLFAAHSLHNRHKGFPLLIQALSGLRGLPNLLLLSLGRGGSRVEVHVPHVHLGHLNNDSMLSLVYSAADLLVIPSLQEAMGQTGLESMSCGVPVVGSAVGGIPDMIRPGVTGLLAPPGDADALGGAIRRLLQNPVERAEMGANCRRIALEEYAIEAQARRHVTLYERVRKLCQQ